MVCRIRLRGEVAQALERADWFFGLDRLVSKLYAASNETIAV